MPVPNRPEETYPHKQDGKEVQVTRRDGYSPYGPWGPGYRFNADFSPP